MDHLPLKRDPLVGSSGRFASISIFAMLDMGKDLDKRTSGDTEGGGTWQASLGAISHVKLSQGAFRANPPVFLVPPASLLVSLKDVSKLSKCPSDSGPPQ